MVWIEWYKWPESNKSVENTDFSKSKEDIVNSHNKPKELFNSVSRVFVNSAIIAIYRELGSFFDSTDFNDNTINRGYVTIKYKV